MLRKVPVALLAVVLAQAIVGLIWAGSAAARISALEEEVASRGLVLERLARLEEQGAATGRAVERIERKLEGA
ncbi:MAG: hypothetical protein HZY74_02005 [Brevundimonas sp.]|nr:MAG: hypothetical protein HZY74_02005 [Brevundimonas sp.]